MKFVDILARELTEWPNNATNAVVDDLYAMAGRNIGIRFTECGPPVWNGAYWTILGNGCGMNVRWLTEHHIKNSFGCKPSIENIVSKSEWQSARAAYLASIQPARDPEIAAVVDKPANPWRRNRGRKTPPVPVGTRVDVKYRDGQETYGVGVGLGEKAKGSNPNLLAEDWTITGHPSDIMQWRYAEPQQEKPRAQTIEQVIENAEAACEKVNKPFTVCDKYKEAQSIEVDVVFPQESFILPEGDGAILEVEGQDASNFDPIALRDEFKRITAEGAELSQKMAKLTDRMGEIEAALRAEGFALVAIDQSNR